MGTGAPGRWQPGRSGRDFAPVPYPTQTERLAAHVVGLRYEDIPRAAVDKMKEHIVHHLGLALRGLSTGEGRQAVRIAESFGHEGSATIIGRRDRTAPMEAAFANTTLMRSDFLDDVLFPAGVHAALVTLPPALAVAEERRRSGKELLTALIAAYDVIGKLGNPAADGLGQGAEKADHPLRTVRGRRGRGPPARTVRTPDRARAGLRGALRNGPQRGRFRDPLLQPGGPQRPDGGSGRRPWRPSGPGGDGGAVRVLEHVLHGSTGLPGRLARHPRHGFRDHERHHQALPRYGAEHRADRVDHQAGSETTSWLPRTPAP